MATVAEQKALEQLRKAAPYYSDDVLMDMVPNLLRIYSGDIPIRNNGVIVNAPGSDYGLAEAGITSQEAADALAGGVGTDPAGGLGAPSDVDTNNALEAVRAAFPWVDQLGIMGLVEEWIRDGFTGDALLGLMRQSNEYKTLFPAIRRPNGTLRMNEAAYLARDEEYRRILRQHFGGAGDYSSPSDTAVFHESEQDPQELRDRVELFDSLKRADGGIRAAFHVYGGIQMTDEDLYLYVVDPSAREKFDRDYFQRTATQTLDYDTFISRVAEYGLARAVDHLRNLQASGLSVEPLMAQLGSLDVELAKQVADVLYTGGTTTAPAEAPEQADPQNATLLSLAELTSAFELALIGGAAVDQGLVLPSRERTEAIRQAGVDRARALQEFSRFAQQQGLIQGTVQRAGGGLFTQSDCEEAVFLRRAPEAQLLERAERQEEALGRAGGGAQILQGPGGSLQQTGLRRRFV